MIKQITKEVNAKKAAGIKKVRVILSTTIERNGRQVPQVVWVSEFETEPAILKSGQLAAPIRKQLEQCEGLYSHYQINAI